MALRSAGCGGSDSWGIHTLGVCTMEIVWYVVVGIAAGWIAGVVMKGRGLGLWGNLIVGVVGALVGGFLFGLLGIGAGGLVGRVAIAAVGAIVLLAFVRLIRRI